MKVLKVYWILENSSGFVRGMKLTNLWIFFRGTVFKKKKGQQSPRVIFNIIPAIGKCYCKHLLSCSEQFRILAFRSKETCSHIASQVPELLFCIIKCKMDSNEELSDNAIKLFFAYVAECMYNPIHECVAHAHWLFSWYAQYAWHKKHFMWDHSPSSCDIENGA